MRGWQSAPYSHSKLWLSWEKGLSKMKLPRWTPWSVRVSTPSGGNALISAVNVAMSAESVRHHCRATIASLTNETQLIVCGSKVVHNGPLILSQFPTPQAVCESGELPEGFGIMNSL